jgi:hypothetical protein
MGDVRQAAVEPTWSSWRQIPAVCRYRPHLRRTVSIALIVGVILFAINQLDVVVTGHASAAVWLKAGLTFLVPFCVSNYGVVIATHRRALAGE